jgi:hypothetical protein
MKVVSSFEDMAFTEDQLSQLMVGGIFDENFRFDKINRK